MKIAKKETAKTIQVSDTCVAIEYPLLDKKIHCAKIILNGRYPEQGQVVNEKCTEMAFVISGFGKLVVNGKKINFKEGDLLLIKPKEKYYWDGHTEIFVPCVPAWYPEQHKQILDKPE